MHDGMLWVLSLYAAYIFVICFLETVQESDGEEEGEKEKETVKVVYKEKE